MQIHLPEWASGNAALQDPKPCFKKIKVTNCQQQSVFSPVWWGFEINCQGDQYEIAKFSDVGVPR